MIIFKNFYIVILFSKFEKILNFYYGICILYESTLVSR